MGKITTALASPELWEDVQHTLNGGGDGRSCQCIWPVLSNKDWQSTSLESRTTMFQHEIQTGPPPGLVAYVDREAAGWMRIGKRLAQRRLPRTRNIISTTREPLDDESIWAVSCFVVRKEHRGKGINAALLDAGIAYARASDARVIEGYPIDTSKVSVPVNDLFHGTLSTFLAAGFSEIPSDKPGRPLVSLDLTV